MDIFKWVESNYEPARVTSVSMIYDGMESQSGYCLPLIYQSFDGGQREHWSDRGALFDFLYTTGGEGKRLLDYGPGDGWPALILAPYVGEVVGVDASLKRVEVCTDNARRMGISNAHFVHVPAGEPLPFPTGSFDGVTAASSIEQSPDPQAALREISRVLRPGGKLRIFYEALNEYRGGKERDLWLQPLADKGCRLILYDRHIDAEWTRQVALTFNLTEAEVGDYLFHGESLKTIEAINIQSLEKLRPYIVGAMVCDLHHPSGVTLARWLRDAGFKQILPTHSGRVFARHLFEITPMQERLLSIDEVDKLLSRAIQVVVHMPAPLETDPMITAIK
jgi:ubiquinone/menaquinone biosynthesis C-methylase UbiE